MEWQDKEFTALTVDELQRIYWLRAQVFNAEQQSSYPEPDEQDRHCHHLFAREGEQVVAYARYFATADGVSFGRVVVAKAYRGTGLGKALLERLLAGIQVHFPGQPITIVVATPVSQNQAPFPGASHHDPRPNPSRGLLSASGLRSRGSALYGGPTGTRDDGPSGDGRISWEKSRLF